MTKRTGLFAAGALACLAGCTTPDPFAAERGAFRSPYAALEMENGPVGPTCDRGTYRDGACWIEGVAYPLPDGYARTPNGEIVRLTRSERRQARERREAVQSRIDVLKSLEEGTPIPADSPALPENQKPPAPKPSRDD